MRFEQPIASRKVKNFSSEAITMKMQGKDMKIRELQLPETCLSGFFTWPLGINHR